MNQLSEEQQFILDNIKKKKNVIVDAVAGSGKSTTVLSIAKEMNDSQLLQLTYNSSLRTEIKEKTRVLNLKNLKIHTYHSLAVRYYLPTSYTDTGIRYILYNKLPSRIPIPIYNIVVIDEAQDMTLVYYQLVVKFIKDMCLLHENHKVQLLILGDVMQGLYEFKGSDIRFLSLADKIWCHNSCLETQEFIKSNMRMSYRITNSMKEFVNNVMLGENRLDSCRDGEPVMYIRNKRINLQNVVIYEIKKLLNDGNHPDDIFVLGASVKGPNSNIRKLENALVREGIPCHVPMIETDKIDERVISGKVVFSTFHCVKGRQRKYVFIIGFDNGYLNFYARNLPKDRCPNTLYVGATRATKGLYLLENDEYATDRPLEFLKLSHHEMKMKDYIHFKGIPRSIFYTKKEIDVKTHSLQEKQYTTPTELIKFIPESVIEEISPIIDRIFISLPIFEEGISEMEIPSIIETRKGFFEEISDLNGIAIPSMYYDSMLGENSNILYEMLQENMRELKENEYLFIKQFISDLPNKMTCISDYLYLANIYVATQEKLYFKLKQIDRDEYRWISESMMEKCKELLKNTIGKECENSVPLVESVILHKSMEDSHEKIDAFLSPYFENQKFRFTARVDLITGPTLWELKCISKISIDHLLQVVIYAWLWKMSHDEEKIFKILNIKTGDLMVLNATMEDLNYIMIALLKGKYMKPIVKNDEEFLQAILQE